MKGPNYSPFKSTSIEMNDLELQGVTQYLNLMVIITRTHI